MGDKARIQTNEKGFILITTYLLIAMLEIFSVAFFTRSHTFIQATERNKNKIIALNMAEAGLDNTVVQLGSNNNYTGISYTTLGNNGGYQATVCPPTCVGVTAPTDSLVRIVQATGYAPNNVSASAGYEVRPVTSYLKIDSTPFEYGAFGDSSLTLTGTVSVDSYDSTLGAYGGMNVSHHGDIASDGTMSISSNATVNGSMVQNPGMDCSPATTSLGSSGALNVNGNQNYILPAGTYRFDSLSISGSATLTATGPVTVYVDGQVSLGGNGVVTSGNSPTNFLIYATGSSAVSVSGTSAFYGAIYAPSSTINNSGTAGFYGAVFSKNYTQNGTSDLHFDQALKNTEGPCTQVKMLHWRETGTYFGGS